MGRKAIRLILFITVLALAGDVLADTFEWDNEGEGPFWNVEANWNPDGLPAAADTAQITIPDANCLIDDQVAAECSTVYVGSRDGTAYMDITGGSLVTIGHLRIGEPSDSNGVVIMSGGVVDLGTITGTNGRLWVGMNGTGTFIMRGGELNVYDKIEIGKNASGVGTLLMEGGTLNFSGNSTDLEIATYGTGSFIQTGGVVNVQDNIKLAQGNSSTTSGVARLCLYGGTMNAGNLRNPPDIYGTPLMDITEGMLTLPGDYSAMVGEYMDRGWIVAYDGLGVVEVTVTGDQTIVTGSVLPPELASHPTPRDRTTTQRYITLSWQPGVFAAAHDVYFGTDFNDVNAATIENPLDVLVGAGQDANTYEPGPLALDQTYYWRVDEVNDLDPNSPWRGVIFQFTVADYVVVDDFESYNEIPETEEGSHLVYYTWVDGYADPAVNGSTIGYLSGASMETATVHGGAQAVPLTYNNNTASYSEVTVSLADLGVTTDWTQDNFQRLSLWFYGNSVNATMNDLYVKLYGPNDTVGSKVVYTGAAAAIQTATWQEWPIDLSLFNLDLSQVAMLGIGFERAGAAGSGVLLIDDIRLYTASEEAQ